MAGASCWAIWHDFIIEQPITIGFLQTPLLRSFSCSVQWWYVTNGVVNLQSAIMDALQLCLGASARATGHTFKLEDFIQTGSPTATVAVTLWNPPGDPYEGATLGPTLTIERALRRPTNPKNSATSTWCIRDHFGNKVCANRQTAWQAMQACGLLEGYEALL